MEKSTDEDFKLIEEKLKYIGLNLDKLPEFITQSQPIQYRPSRYYNENSYQVYKYVDIMDIEILLTPTNRLNSVQEKYSSATNLFSYLNPVDDEGILRHTTFLKMLKDLDIEEVKQIEQEQEELRKNIPYRVKFKDNYLWQIYYSEESKKYFMLVTTKDLDYASFFYLLKMKIEVTKNKKSKKIYVPISHAEYSGKYLKRSEFADMEKYLWLFTNDWPLTYEVYDIDNNLSVQIVGETNIYEKIKSYYRIKLTSKDEASEFYKLAKALFILQTELPHYYKFNTRINRYGNLEFEYEDKKIDYSKLAVLIKNEVNKNKKQIEKLSKERQELQKKLNELKQIAVEQDEEYIQKEKQISMYLQCRKTFFGKVKYFIQTRKNKRLQEKKEENKGKTNVQEQTNIELEIVELQEKEYYTIEDLVKICKQLDKIVSYIKKLKLDIKACENKIENMKLKIKNATLYIEEIDSHEKSIFEFWKFANKDANLMLVQGESQDTTEEKKLSKTFDYEEDLEEFGTQVDKIQRNLFSKDQTDAIFIMDTEQRNIINNMQEEELKHGLEQLKLKAEEERILFQKENFDIFGGISEDSTKIKMIGSKKHREIAKDIIQILDITRNTELEEYKQTLEKQKKLFNEAFLKSNATVDMNIYISNEEQEINTGIQKAHINPKEAIDDIKNNKLYLHKINIKQGDNIIYLSNIMFYENNNKTLPLGMDISDAVLIDLNNKELKQGKKKEFRIVEEKEEGKIEIKQVSVIEYNLVRRQKNDK